MGNDLWLFFGIIVFFFVLWVYAGGPTHPISFAGPYITPITNVGVTSIGYGDAATTNSVKTYFGSASGSGSAVANVLPSARSTYLGTVHIGSSNPQSSTASNEYVAIRNDGTANVSIAGWKIVDANNKNSALIPPGSRTQNGPLQAVVLASGQSAILSTASSNTANPNNNFGDSWYVYLNVNHDIWNDRNDTLTLLDASGKVVDQYQY